MWVALILLMLIGVGIWIYFQQHSQTAGQTGSAASKGNAAVPVLAVTARQGNLNIYLEGLGNVKPLYTVTVHTRVDGALDKVFYTEGQFVKKDQLLAQIDPRPFEAQLLQAEGQELKDQALMDNASVDLQRFKEAGSAVTDQQIKTQEALVHQYEGQLKIDRGQIDAVKLNLAYCRITSPIDGRIGLRLVDPGNIVHAADANGLAVITQLQPIDVVFTLPEDDLPRILSKFGPDNQLDVIAYDRDRKNKLATGKLMAIDNQIDPTTGTAMFKAEFANENNVLYPSQFVNARLKVDTLRDVVIVPAAAVQRSPTTTFVYLVKEDRNKNGNPVLKVDMKNIVPGPLEGERQAVSSGLTAGDQVVTDGVDKLQQDTIITLPQSSPTTNSSTSGPTTKPAGILQTLSVEGPAQR